MSEDRAIKLPKLIGSSNYELWAIRIKAALIAKDLGGFLSRAEGAKSTKDNAKALGYIQLACADGPLMHILNFDNPTDAWNYLDRLYAPRGFSSEFILFKEFFGATLSSLGSVDNYLATIKRVSTNLKAKQLELLNKLIIAWTLYNLGPAYEAFVASITQSYRADTADIDMDGLFTDLMDESRRLESLDEDALVVRTRKPPRAKCGGCGRTGYKEETCYKLHPEIRPSPNTSPIIDVLYAAHSDLLYSVLLTNPHSTLYSGSVTPFYDLPIASQKGLSTPFSDLPVAAHSNLSHSALPVASLRGLSMGGSALSAKRLSGNWILDSGATSHICSDIDFFNRVAPTSASIAWGNARTLPARGEGTITVLLPNSASAVLESVLYMPELGLKILSIPRLL